MGTAPQGSRGWERGLLGRAWEGLGGGPERKAPSADWNKVAALGAQPGFIDLARCSSHQAGPGPGRLPAFPGVGTPWGNGFSCGYGVGLPPSTWGRPGRWGHAAVGGSGDPESYSLPMSGSWRQGHDSGLRGCSDLGGQSSRLSERPLCARHSSEPFLRLSSSSSRHPRRWVLRSSPLTDGETEAQQG